MWSRGHKLKKGKYIIGKILGKGGFGITYLAYIKQSHKLVTLKTLNSDWQDKKNFDELQERFVNEALSLAKCQHPNIVKVYEVFQEKGLWCMVMEYIEGKNLYDYLSEKGILSEEEALGIILQIAKALNYVHKQGLLHRDVKPNNIMLRKDNKTAVLIDFGLAREYNLGETIQMTSAMTPNYAPLEQWEKRSDFGPALDVYALAATLYKILTNESPIPAVYIKKGAPFTPPKAYNKQISDQVNNLIIIGMKLEAENRPQSVKQWLELFGEFSSNHQINGEKESEVLQKKSDLSFGRKIRKIPFLSRLKTVSFIGIKKKLNAFLSKKYNIKQSKVINNSTNLNYNPSKNNLNSQNKSKPRKPYLSTKEKSTITPYNNTKSRKKYYHSLPSIVNEGRKKTGLPPIIRNHLGWEFWREWVRGTTIAEVIALILSSFLVNFLSRNTNNDLINSIASLTTAAALVGSILGTSVGIAQSSLISREISLARIWIPASIVGGAMGGFLGGFASEVIKNGMDIIIIFPIAGAVIGLAQWFVIRKDVKYAFWWIFGSAISWITIAIGFFHLYDIFWNSFWDRQLTELENIFAWAKSLMPLVFSSLIYILFSGAVFAGITGSIIISLLRIPVSRS